MFVLNAYKADLQALDVVGQLHGESAGARLVADEFLEAAGV